MSRPDQWRRLVSLVLAVVCLLLVPQLATASFVSRPSAGLQVGTATMVAPQVSGTYSCRPGNPERVTVQVTGLTDAGPAGSTYVYRLLRSGTERATAESTGTPVTLEVSQPRDPTLTIWTLTVQGKLKGWTSPVGTVHVECGTGASNGWF